MFCTQSFINIDFGRVIIVIMFIENSTCKVIFLLLFIEGFLKDFYFYLFIIFKYKIGF